MTSRILNTRNVLWEAAKQQGPALACAVTVGAVVVALFHAPLGATLAGCGLGLVTLFARTWRNQKSS